MLRSASLFFWGELKVGLKFILREDQGPSCIERLFLGYGDKWPRKWPRNGTGFAGIGMDWPGLENWMVVGSLKMLTWIGTGSAVVGMDWHSDRHRLAGVGLFYLWGKKNWHRVGEGLTLELFRVAVHRPCIGWGLH